MGKSQNLYNEAKKIIPGGTQLLSKRPEMFLPEQWPAYYQSAKGIEVTDLDGNTYKDVSYMGIGSCVLGYANEEVDAAAKAAIDNGGMCTLNAPEEVALANKLLELNPWADMVRYGKAGGEAMAIAVRIARAYTKRDVVLICGYHGWYDWYLATNLRDTSALNAHHLQGLNPAGVPAFLADSTFPFLYNNIQEFQTLVTALEGKIAAVVMEPVRNDYPDPAFMAEIRRYTQEHDIVLIFDEITAGFRLACGGSHKDARVGIEPDIAVFGKAIANGYPVTAIVGRGKVMTAAEDSFISSTFWTERIGFAAALKAIEVYERDKVHEWQIHVGQRATDTWKKAAQLAGIEVEIGGILPISHFSFVTDEPLKCKTAFSQLMLDRGYLASTALYASIAHTDAVMDQYDKDVTEVFGIIGQAIANGTLDSLLKGPVCHAGFQRLNG